MRVSSIAFAAVVLMAVCVSAAPPATRPSESGAAASVDLHAENLRLREEVAALRTRLKYTDTFSSRARAHIERANPPKEEQLTILARAEQIDQSIALHATRANALADRVLLAMFAGAPLPFMSTEELKQFGLLSDEKWTANRERGSAHFAVWSPGSGDKAYTLGFVGDDVDKVITVSANTN
jgi:hypothetical protein